MRPFSLPSFGRLRADRRPTAVAALLVLSVGGAAIAVTGQLHAGASGAMAGQTLGQRGSIPTTAPAVTKSPKPIRLSTRPKHLIESTLLVTRAGGLSARDLHAVRHLAGVARTQLVMAGNSMVDGHKAFVLGVNPQTFRPWTPKLTAKSNPLWASVTRGDLTASFDMGHDAKLPLGQTVSVSGRHAATRVRIGAFASVGMAGVDAVVSQSRAHEIGLASRSGLLVSAPNASSTLAVRKATASIFGKRAHVELLRQVIVTRDAGEFLTRAKIQGFLNAVASRVGAPYVWGATGPSSFDCSGLVQWAFARVGITMPRVAQEQFFAGPHVPYSDARPGDLLFWHYDPTDPSAVDHVAIYIGNGQEIEAPHTGERVKVTAVSLPHLAGVVRVDPSQAKAVA